jgi:ANTAR domain-containing protein
VLARHAAIALATNRTATNLWHAIDARKLIGQAQGMLMERFDVDVDVDVDADQAFAVLRRYSQDNNIKLRDVAQRLVDTHDLFTPSSLRRTNRRGPANAPIEQPPRPRRPRGPGEQSATAAPTPSG